MEYDVILTCEHASNAIPRAYQPLFLRKCSLLQSHRGYDIGAWHYASAIARATSWPLFCGKYSRLLVDLNRSSRVFSEVTRQLPVSLREQIVQSYYEPFRSAVLECIRNSIESGRGVIHLSCHTCTPVLRGTVRRMDIGLLYDPHRPSEVHFVEDLQRRLTEHTSMRIRRNFPYRGGADGHATALRRLFSQDQYVGIEIEVNQSLYQSERCSLWKQVWLPRLEEVLQFCAACHR